MKKSDIKAKRADIKAKNKKLAEERMALLWDYYETNGKITLAQIETLTGRKASNLYKSFVIHGLKGPPIFDSHEQIRKRQVAILNDRAKELGRNWLTSEEAGLALGIQTKNVFRVDERLKRDIPEIRYSKTRAKKQQPLTDMAIDKVREHIGSPYTLKYYRKEAGPQSNQTTYYLR